MTSMMLLPFSVAQAGIKLRVLLPPAPEYCTPGMSHHRELLYIFSFDLLLCIPFPFPSIFINIYQDLTFQRLQKGTLLAALSTFSRGCSEECQHAEAMKPPSALSWYVSLSWIPSSLMLLFFTMSCLLSVVAHICNPSTREAEAEP